MKVSQVIQGACSHCQRNWAPHSFSCFTSWWIEQGDFHSQSWLRTRAIAAIGIWDFCWLIDCWGRRLWFSRLFSVSWAFTAPLISLFIELVSGWVKVKYLVCLLLNTLLLDLLDCLMTLSKWLGFWRFDFVSMTTFRHLSISVKSLVQGP